MSLRASTSKQTPYCRTYATDHYRLLHIDARNRLASCRALAILSLARADVPRPCDEAVCQDLPADEGIVEQGYFSRPECSTGGKTSRPPLPRPPSDPQAPGCARLENTTLRDLLQVRHLLPLSAWWLMDSTPGGAVDFRLEVRRSIYGNRVNSVRNLALSIELRTKFLNELAPPVNIAY
jgi:hypothetical protein